MDRLEALLEKGLVLKSSTTLARDLNVSEGLADKLRSQYEEKVSMRMLRYFAPPKKILPYTEWRQR